MKTGHIITFLFLFFSLTIYSQVVDDISTIPPQNKESEKKVKKSESADYNDNTANLKIRHLKGMKCMDIQYGWATYGTFYNLGYGQLLKDKLMLNIHLNYEYGKIGTSKYDYKNLKFGLNHSVYKIKNTVFLNIGYGAIAGFIQGVNEDISVREQKFNTGIYAGGNLEIYLFNKFSVVGLAEQQYNFMDKFGKWHFHLGGGLRLYIY